MWPAWMLGMEMVGQHCIMQQLLKKGARIEAKESDSDTALHWAARRGYLKIVQLLLESGANGEARGRDGKRPLDMAKESLSMCPANQSQRRQETLTLLERWM